MTTKFVLGPEEIREILPHRPPFLFVDEVSELVSGERIVGHRHIAESDSYVSSDHGGQTFFPPTLLVEAMAQVGAILVLNPKENRGKTIYFRAIESFRFHRRVPVGSHLRIEGTVRRLRGRLGRFAMKAFLDQALVAEGVMAFALSDGE